MKRWPEPTPAPLAAAKNEPADWRGILTESVNRARMLHKGEEGHGASCTCPKDNTNPRILPDSTFFHLLRRLVSLTDADFVALVQAANYRRCSRAKGRTAPRPV